MSRRKPSRPSIARRSPWPWFALAGTVVVALVAIAAWMLTRPDTRQQAEKAEAAGDWSTALDRYRNLTRSNQARARDWLGLARAHFGLNQAREAEAALHRAAKLDPADTDAWHLLLELFRVERRGVEAIEIGQEALISVRDEGRKPILRDLTLALLFLDTPLDARAELRARETLSRWLAADPEDDNARAALALRMAFDPNPDDPDRAARIADLAHRVELQPDHVALHQALVLLLADAGEIDEGRAHLDAWPDALRDVRYDRLRARWDLEYDRRAAEAVTSLRRVVNRFPSDWRSHYNLSRALKSLGRDSESAAEAETVNLLRERLEPNALAARLARALAHLDAPDSLRDLATLCTSVGLAQLGQAWTKEAVRLASH